MLVINVLIAIAIVLLFMSLLIGIIAALREHYTLDREEIHVCDLLMSVCMTAEMISIIVLITAIVMMLW